MEVIGNSWRLAHTLTILVWLVVKNFTLKFCLPLGCFYLILAYCCLQIMYFLLKKKPFLKIFLVKVHFKNSFRVFRIKISFFKIICNHVLIGSQLSQFSEKIMVLSKTWIGSKLVVLNKWNNSMLDLCISIGELVEPLYKIIF